MKAIGITLFCMGLVIFGLTFLGFTTEKFQMFKFYPARLVTGVLMMSVGVIILYLMWRIA